jgi:hypothetical protein
VALGPLRIVGVKRPFLDSTSRNRAIATSASPRQGRILADSGSRPTKGFPIGNNLIQGIIIKSTGINSAE